MNLQIDDLKGALVTKATQNQLNLLELSGVCSVHIEEHLVFAEAYGSANMVHEVKNNIETSFGTASVAKGFTAVAILKLIEEQKFAYTTPVIEIMPNCFPHMSAEVTIEHLLNHTSGFHDYFDEDLDIDYEDLWKDIPQYRMTEPKAFMPLLRENTMEFTPGSAFKYNNGAFVILAMIVERISGVPFTDFVTQNILIPAGMTRSGYFRMDNLPANTATGYTEDAQGQLKANIYSLPIIGGGDGGIYTTTSDMSKFWEALRKGRLLSGETLKKAWSPVVYSGEGSLYYGLGFWIVKTDGDIEKIFLMGSDPGVSCRSCYYPNSNIVITVLCNRDSGCFKAYKLLEAHLLEELPVL